MFVMEGYWRHLHGASAPLNEFFLEILGSDLAHQDVGGVAGDMKIHTACSLAGLFVFEFVLCAFFLSCVWSLLTSKKFYRYLILGIISLILCYFFCTTRTRNEITQTYLGVEVEWLPQLVNEDYISINAHSLQIIFDSFYAAGDATLTALALWAIAILRVLGPLIRLVIRVLIVVAPVMKTVMLNLIDKFLAQDPTNIYLEIGTVVFLILSWLLKRHIQRAR